MSLHNFMLFFYGNFPTVILMVNVEIPDNWLTLVKPREEHKDEAGNDLTHLWARREFHSFHNDEEMEEPSATESESTIQKSNQTHVMDLNSHHD